MLVCCRDVLVGVRYHTVAGPTIVMRTSAVGLSSAMCSCTRDFAVPLTLVLAPPHPAAAVPLASLLNVTSIEPVGARSREQPAGKKALLTVRVDRVVLGKSFVAASKHSAAVWMPMSAQAGPECFTT